MRIFEYPYIIITILALCFFVLTAIGIYFALRGLKTANGRAEMDFVNISKLENCFAKLGKLRENRSVFYVSVSLDNFSSLYSEIQTTNIFSEIKRVLLESFSDNGNGTISINGEKNFVALTKWDEETAREKVEIVLEKLNKCLLKYTALNIINIRIGAYYAFGTQVSFDDAINRAKQAFMLAKNNKIPYAEWNVSEGKELEKKIKIERIKL